MRRWFTLIALIGLVTATVAGGDIATFENLGFSENSGIFVFGQYGVTGEASQPFAEIYVVDVAGNRFVSNGVFELESDRPLSLGQDGRGALYTLLATARPTLETQDIDHLSTGRPIYVLVDGDEPRDRLTFRDFNSEIRYDVRLDQQIRGEGDGASGAFSLDVTLTYGDGRVRSLTIGRPGFFREGVDRYRITQMLVGPDEASLIVVVEKRSPDGSIRYMVETASL